MNVSPVILCLQSSVFRIEQALYGGCLSCLFRFSLPDGKYHWFIQFLGVPIDEPWSIPLSTRSKRGQKLNVFVILTLNTNHDSQNATRPRYGFGEGECPSGTSLFGGTNVIVLRQDPQSAIEKELARRNFSAGEGVSRPCSRCIREYSSHNAQ